MSCPNLDVRRARPHPASPHDRTWMATSLVLLLALTTLVSGCDDGEATAEDTFGSETDTRNLDGLTSDAPSSDLSDTLDVPSDGRSDDADTAIGLDQRDAPDTSMGIVDTRDAVEADATACAGACRVVTLEATFDGDVFPFDRAFYGLTAPSQSTSGEWEVHLEAHAGGSSECPTEASPTPDRTVVLSGLTVVDVEAPSSGPLDSGLSASLLDFEGSVLGGEPVASATFVEVTAQSGDVCTGCVGQPAPSDPDGFVALDLHAELDAGTISGHVFAAHCDSMDVGE